LNIEDAIKEYLQIDESSPSGLSWAKSKYRTKVVKDRPAFTSIDGRGYYHGRINRQHMKAHRIVYFLHTGTWPETIDHIDGVRTNNLIENLAGKTYAENNHNVIRNGYWPLKKTKKFISKIRANGKYFDVGIFNSKEEARAAYLKAKKKLHPTAPSRCFSDLTNQANTPQK
jgi:hypothetical protein